MRVRIRQTVDADKPHSAQISFSRTRRFVEGGDGAEGASGAPGAAERWIGGVVRFIGVGMWPL